MPRIQYEKKRFSLSPREVSERTGAPLSLVRRMINDGRLRARQQGGRWFVDPESVREQFGFETAPVERNVKNETRVDAIAARILKEAS